MDVRSPLEAAGATRNDWFLDVSVAVLGLVVVHVPFLIALVLLAKTVSLRSIIIAAVFGAAAFASLCLRRHYPTGFFALVVLLIVPQIILLGFPTVSWALLPVAVFDVARWMPSRQSTVCLVVALTLIMAGPARWILTADFDPSGITAILILGIVSGVGVVSTAYTIGRRGYDVGEARARQLMAEHSAAELRLAEEAARQRTLESRIRTDISRELHDIVAHSVAVMVVQAEGGLTQVDRSPETTRQALTTVSETGREALQGMRRIVRMLRSDVSDDQASQIDPAFMPRVADYPALVEKSGAVLTVTGTPHGLTPSIEATIYRVIQEALTNSLKHGGPDADPQVGLLWSEQLVTVTITNRLTRPVESGDHRGVGLLGMTERVQALDGVLTVGPDQTGRFIVCAQIPLQTRLHDR